MSNEYAIGDSLTVIEQSNELQYLLCNENCSILVGKTMTAEEFQLVIIRQIEVLSYYAADGDAVLKRFNVNYGDTK